ncbi:MAG TPA: SRPBCC family protein, partial [Solirubrobacteraceae bacterium]|nr:SRPBCC family protein [Solirubrobacteraceae bacterium]
MTQQQESIADELKQAIRQAALESLGPAVRQGTRSAAKLAVAKAPELVAKYMHPGDGGSRPGDLGGKATAKAAEALSGMGGRGRIAGFLLSKLTGRGGGGAPTGAGRGRRMPVQQHIYLSLPIKQAYVAWTEYKQWPRYMHRVNQLDTQIDEKAARLKITEKMWGFSRPFTAEVVTQRPYERIKWNTTEGPRHGGVINFHEVAPRLTLVEVNVDHWPSGPVEKVARGARFVKRAVRADLHRFQGWIEMKDDDELDAMEGWRGTVEQGRIVKSHEDALDEERQEQGAGQADGGRQAERVGQ